MTDTMLADRSLLRLSGEDVRGFLQGLVTNDVTGPLPVWTGLLTPQGKALFDFMLWEDSADKDAILIDCEASAAEALARRLTLYRLRRPITIERIAGSVHWSLEAGRGSPDPRLPDLGYRWLEFLPAASPVTFSPPVASPPVASPPFASPAQAGAQLREADDDARPPVTSDIATGPRPAPGKEESAALSWLVHRLSLGVTEGLAELGSDQTLWLECNARELNGVSFTKGCYVGQENTARMHHRSKVNRRLVVAPLGKPGDRARATYPELGLMVEHRRVEASGDAIIPTWLDAS